MATNDRVVNLLMPGDLADRLTTAAGKKGWSRAELLRRLAVRYLNEKEQHK